MPEPRSLAQPSARFKGDDGSPDPAVRAAIAGAVEQVGYARALVALCAGRLLLPMVASGDDTGHHDPDRHAEMAAVTLSDASGTYLLAFTGYDSLRAWQADARPVPCLLDELCATVGPAGATQLLLDVAGPVPFVIGEDAVARMADGNALTQLGDGSFAWVRAE